MSDLTRDQVIDYLSALPVMEIAELVKALEDKWGVSAAAPVAIAAGPAAGGAEAAEEKTEFDVVLESFGEKKIAVIKALRAEVQGLGLKEAKAMVEGAPQAIKEAVPKEEAEKLKKALEEAGGKVTIK